MREGKRLKYGRKRNERVGKNREGGREEREKYREKEESETTVGDTGRDKGECFVSY